jgi:hypothetical protein
MDMSISDSISDIAFSLLPVSGACMIENHAITFKIGYYLKDPAQKPGIGYLCLNPR